MKSSVKSFSILFGLVAAFSFAACKVSVNPKDDNHEYTVKFNSMGGSPVESQTVVKGQKASRPADPTKVTTNQETYYFLNWYTSTNKGQPLSSTAFSFNTPITSNITLYAKWTDTDLELPLTLEFISSGTVTVSNPWSTLKYSKNGSDLLAYTGDITVNADDKICLYAQESENTELTRMIINCSSDCYIYGNVMSLVTFDSQTGEWDPYASSVSSYAFYRLFINNSHIKNHDEKKIYLPATTLANHCYFSMFSGCTKLTAAPDLPATTLTNHCYQYMFKDCTSLTTAPALPAITLSNYCYFSMFSGCTSLTAAPALPATTLARFCYEYMFKDCTSLTTAPDLPATTLADYCYNSMFSGCTKLNSIKCLATDISASGCTGGWVNSVSQTGTFTKNKNMNDWATGSDGIPSGWTVKNAN